MLRVYLAGPDVFLPNAREIGARKKAICEAHGLEGRFPLDAELELTLVPPAEAGFRIYRANRALMESCDLAIANMTPFRGPSMDVGTAFEMGFMRGLGRPVLGYTNVAGSLLERTRLFFADHADGMSIEDFDMVDNLMLDGAVIESGFAIVRNAVRAEERHTNLDGFTTCVRRAAEQLNGSSSARA
jgi:nucleoside 2-deoxyribosyltransferase